MMDQINAIHSNISLHFYYVSQYPSLQSAGPNHTEICFQYFSYFLHEFFFYFCSVLESSASLSWHYRKLSLQSKMNILENGLFFFFFMDIFCNTCIFLILVSRMPLSPRVTKLEGRRGVIFLQPAPRVSASSFPRVKPHV